MAGESWLNINNIYSCSLTLYQNSKVAYDRLPVMPFFQIESAYENDEHNSTAQQLRSQAYYPVLSGGAGYVFGNCPIWHFGSSAGWCGLTNWKTQLNNPGSVSMMYVQKLFTSRAWHLLVPDFNHTVLNAGYGSWGSTDYAAAARTGNGNTVIAYLPSSRTVTIDLTKLSGTQAACWWYNPANGSATSIGTYPTSGAHSFTPPSSGDWVLVIDDAARNLPAPGSSAAYPHNLISRIRFAAYGLYLAHDKKARRKIRRAFIVARMADYSSFAGFSLIANPCSIQCHLSNVKI